jgi:hypothetical protein
VLSGGEKIAISFVYLFYDYDHSFFSTDKRKIKMVLPFHQIEGVTKRLAVYLTNKTFTRKPF